MGYSIDQRQLLVEIGLSEPVFKKEADRVIKTQFFDPAVAKLKAEFESSAVTREIAGGINAPNDSGTLEAPFREDAKDDSPANLTSFIGFDKSPEEVLAPIRERLDPNHEDGPKMEYQGRDRDKMAFRYNIKAPNEEAIFDETGIPWADGISWVKRIEQGISGIGHFLNVFGRPSSRSGGGIQIEGTLRSGRFRPTSYLSKMLNNFLRRVAGLSDNGRSV